MVKMRQIHFRKKGINLKKDFLREYEAERQVNKFMKKYSYLFDDDPGRAERYKARIEQYNNAEKNYSK